MSDFKKGQTVFSVDGEQLEFVGKLDGINYVRHVIDRGDDEPYVSDVHKFHGDIFAEPAVFKIEERCARLLLEHKDICEEIETAQQRLSEIKSQTFDFEKLAKKHEDFRALVDYLEGRITHVVFSNSAEIATLESVLTRKEDWEESQRPIGLFACPNNATGSLRRFNKVSWKIGTYRDGSGCWRELCVFTSEQAARDYVSQIVNEKLCEWRKDHNMHYFWLHSAIDKNPWLELPEDWLAYEQELKISGAKRVFNDAEKRFLEAKEALAKAEAQS